MLAGQVIRFQVLAHEDVPDAVQALLDTAVAYPQGDYTVGPFDNAELATRVIFVDGPDEVEAAQVLVDKLGANGVRWEAL